MAEDPESPPDEESVFEPDELDIEDDEHVRALGDNRYVVSADEPISEGSEGGGAGGDTTDSGHQRTNSDASPGRNESEPPPRRGEDAVSRSGGEGERSPHRGVEDDAGPRGGSPKRTQGRTDPLEGSLDVHRARARLTERMAEESGAYGFDVTAQFGDRVVQQHLQANDIVTVFDALLLWYAEHLDDETPAEEAIGLLLAESDIPVQFPTNSLYELVEAHGLNGSDTIADLVEAVGEDTVEFPPK